MQDEFYKKVYYYLDLALDKSLKDDDRDLSRRFNNAMAVYGKLLRGLSDNLQNRKNQQAALCIPKIKKIIKDYTGRFLASMCKLKLDVDAFILELKVDTDNQYGKSLLHKYIHFNFVLCQTIHNIEEWYDKSVNILSVIDKIKLKRTPNVLAQLKLFTLSEQDKSGVDPILRACLHPDIHASLLESASRSADVMDLGTWILSPVVIQQWMDLVKAKADSVKDNLFVRSLIGLQDELRESINSGVIAGGSASVCDRVLNKIKAVEKQEDSALNVNIKQIVGNLFGSLFQPNGRLNDEVLLVTRTLFDHGPRNELKLLTMNDDDYRQVLSCLIVAVVAGVQCDNIPGQNLQFIKSDIIPYFEKLITSAAAPFQYVLPAQHVDCTQKSDSDAAVISKILAYMEDATYNNINLVLHVRAEFITQYADKKCFANNVTFSSEPAPDIEQLPVMQKAHKPEEFNNDCLARLRQYAGCSAYFNVIPYCRKHHLQRAQVLLKVLSSNNLCVQDKLSCVQYQLRLYDTPQGTDASSLFVKSGSSSVVAPPADKLYAARFKQAFNGDAHYARLHRAFKHQAKQNGGYFRLLIELKQSLKPTLRDDNSPMPAGSTG